MFRPNSTKQAPCPSWSVLRWQESMSPKNNNMPSSEPARYRPPGCAVVSGTVISVGIVVVGAGSILVTGAAAAVVAAGGVSTGGAVAPPHAAAKTTEARAITKPESTGVVGVWGLPRPRKRPPDLRRL